MPAPVIEIGESGLYCAAGDFYIDPWQPVERAVVTHAHSDHARPGSRAYLAAAAGAGVLQRRLGAGARIETTPYGERRTIGDATVSLHPAGHLLGSAQVRVEVDGAVWVVSGDYKTARDPTCEAFEPVPCHTFISECTFGLPVYRWPDAAEVSAEIHEWWRENRAEGRTSVMFVYALGKAQRVLAGLDPAFGPILLHGAVARLCEAYAGHGVRLPPAAHATPGLAASTRGQAIVLAPPSASRSPWLRRFGDVSTAFVSGWMAIRGARRRRHVDRGFTLSDHADWDGLHAAIEATGAEAIGLTHGFTEPMARWLGECGRATAIYRTRFEGERDDDDPAGGGERRSDAVDGDEAVH